MHNTKFNQTTTLMEEMEYRTAQDAWSRFAGNSFDYSKMNPVQHRQVELILWERGNFGLQLPLCGGLGAFEEFQELIDAMEADDPREIVDAIGDIMVFSCNILSKMRSDFYMCMQAATLNKPDIVQLSSPFWRELMRAVGWASHVLLKSHQRIRGYDDVAVRRRDTTIATKRLLSYVVLLCDAHRIDPFDTFMQISSEVLPRDWRRDPLNGKTKDTLLARTIQTLEEEGLLMKSSESNATSNNLRGAGEE